MLELGVGADIARSISLIYWLLAIAALIASIKFPEDVKSKVIAVILVIVVFGYLPGEYGYQVYRFKKKQSIAREYFQKRCEDSGADIRQTVDGVEGVYLMKVRKYVNRENQYTPDDVYGFDSGEDEYIRSFLRVTEGLALDPEKKLPYHKGYQWVEAHDLKDHKLYRYRLRLFRPYDRDPSWLETHVRPEFIKEPISKPTAHYGVTFANISTKQDRDHWVAGGSITIYDLHTKQVVAKHQGFMWDSGIGGGVPGNANWIQSEHYACPLFPARGPTDHRREKRHRETMDFTSSVLKPN